MKNSDMPAMPVPPVERLLEMVGNKNHKVIDDFMATFGGLTKREHFAGLALQGLLASDIDFVKDPVVIAVECADALLKELEREQ